eukprot:scaffold4081_cov268-Pinguiococcus_pyrenoidosus.AAC.3
MKSTRPGTPLRPGTDQAGDSRRRSERATRRIDLQERRLGHPGRPPLEDFVARTGGLDQGRERVHEIRRILLQLPLVQHEGNERGAPHVVLDDQLRAVVEQRDLHAGVDQKRRDQHVVQRLNVGLADGQVVILRYRGAESPRLRLLIREGLHGVGLGERFLRHGSRLRQRRLDLHGIVMQPVSVVLVDDRADGHHPDGHERQAPVGEEEHSQDAADANHRLGRPAEQPREVVGHLRGVAREAAHELSGRRRVVEAAVLAEQRCHEPNSQVSHNTLLRHAEEVIVPEVQHRIHHAHGEESQDVHARQRQISVDGGADGLANQQRTS